MSVSPSSPTPPSTPTAEHVIECAGCHSREVEWTYNEQGIALCLCHTCGCRFWDRLSEV